VGRHGESGDGVEVGEGGGGEAASPPAGCLYGAFRGNVFEFLMSM